MEKPLWQARDPAARRMGEFLRFVAGRHHAKLSTYQDLHAWSIDNLADFWQALCDFFSIHFSTPPTEILNPYTSLCDARWFSGARLNFAEQLLKRRDDHTAIIAIDERGNRVTWTYQQLYQAVAGLVKSLQALGVQPGDRIAAIMPNIAETIIAMLATTALGAIWSSCSPDFGQSALIDRLAQLQPTVLFACDGYRYQGKVFPCVEKVRALVAAIPSIKEVIIYPMLQEAPAPYTAWADLVKPAKDCDFVQLPFAHPVYILFSSGTTGKPKCIMHSAGGTLLQHVKELGLHTDIRATDNLCFYTTCGWMMWNWMVSALSLGATLTLYEGHPAYPNFGRLFQLIAEEGVTVFGTSAKFISSVDKAQFSPKAILASAKLRCILSTGSPLLPKNFDFVYQAIKEDVQLASISGGTDIVSCFALGNPLVPVYRGQLQSIGLGMAVEIFNDAGHAVVEERGELVCTKPFPAMPLGFWQDPGKIAYQKAYFARFPGVWSQGDFALKTKHGGLIIYGRSDAVLNPGGVRIGTAEIYRQIENIHAILEAVAIGQAWKNDERIVLFVKLQDGLELTPALITTIKNTLREHASPRHVPARILQVADIPRTINGKITELAVRQVVHQLPVNNLASIANPKALDYFKDREELKH